MEYRGRFGVCVSGYLHVPFTQGPKGTLWGEQSMWDFLAKEMEVPIIDEGIAKLTSEFLVQGYAYPDPQTPGSVAARVKLGGVKKTLLAFGERYWINDQEISDPRPFERMPLNWQHAYGGPDYPINPLGRGRVVEDGLRWLPNLELPGSRITKPDQTVVPAAYTPLDVMHPQRAAHRGTYDEAWYKEHSPGFAPDLNWKHFNCAPRDQWLETPLVGDEPFRLENLHPTQPVIEGALPGLRVRVFLNYRISGESGGGFKLREVAMRPTTVWFFPHAERMVLVFHGLAESTEDDGSDIAHLLGAIERIGDEGKRPDSHYVEVLRKRTGAADAAAALESLNDHDLVPADLDTVDPTIAAIQEGLKVEGLQAEAQYRRAQMDMEIARQLIRSTGKDPDALGVVMPAREKPPTPEQMPAYIEKVRKQVEDEPWLALEAVVTQVEKAIDLKLKHKVDLQKVVQRGPPPRQAMVLFQQLEQSHLKSGKRFDAEKIGPKLLMMDMAAQENYLQSAHLQAPAHSLKGAAGDAARAEVEWLLDKGHRKMPMIDLTGVDLSNLDLRHVDFSGAWLESANFTGSNLSYANFAGAVLAHANFTGAVAIRANFTAANLGAANLERAVFDQSDLSHAILMRTRFDRCDFRGSQLQKAQVLESRWKGADWSGATATEMIFHKLDLKGCTFADAQMPRCTFLECDLGGVDFSGANLEAATFVTCKAQGARFRGAQLPSAAFVSGTQLQRADFSAAALKNTNLADCDLTGARFVQAQMDGANLIKAVLTDSDLHLANATGALLRKATLRRARLVGVNFKDAILQYADLRGADLRDAHLFGAALMRVHLDGDVKLDGAELERARLYPRRKAAPATS